MNTRFYIDPETGFSHIYNHNVDEDEAAFGDAASQTVVQIPQELLPIVRKLLAEHLG